MIRHHRLLEQYLAQTLGLEIDAVHAEADRLEHALSEEVEARIDASLGYPTHDPHGDPIPDANLRLAASDRRRSAWSPARRRRSAASRTARRGCCATSPSSGSYPEAACVRESAPFAAR